MVIINRLNGGDITITTGGSTPSEPTAPNGKVLYKTSADGEWLQSDADITNGEFNGFNETDTEKERTVAVIIPSKDASGNDVTSIGSSSFNYCTSLTNVTIPASVTNISEAAFYVCNEIVSFTVDDGNVNYKSVNGLLLTKDGNTLIRGVNGDVTIPDSVTSIRSMAFAGYSGLSSVTISNSVTSIGNYAFSLCSYLMSMTIPDSVTTIGSPAMNVTITANGGNAENVKQMLISAGVSSSINWNMPS